MQWAFSNEVSGSSQLLSFKGFEEERPKKVIHDSQVSSGSVTTQILDVLNSKWKLQSREPQTSIDKKAQEKCALTIYPRQHLNGISANYSQEVNIYSGSNRPNETASQTPVLQSNFSSVRENMVCSTVNSQPLGGLLVLPPVSLLPSMGSTVGYTDYRSASKPPEVPAQMTIFYAGSVNVYDVTMEKAQAIMLLASGNGPPVTHSKTLATSQGQVQGHGVISRITTDESSRGNRPQNISAFLGLPNLVSVTSQSGTSSGGRSACNNETTMTKQAGSLSCVSKSETSKVFMPIGPGAASLLPSVALPQARKASLARFLEKRKERVVSSSPYPYAMDKKSPDWSTSTLNEISFSILNSSVPCPQSVAK